LKSENNSEKFLQNVIPKAKLLKQSEEIDRIPSSSHKLNEELKNTFALRKDYFQLALKNSNISIFHQDKNLRFTWIYNPGVYTPANPVIGKTDYDIHSKQDADYLTSIKYTVLKSGEKHKSLIEIKYNHSPKFFDYYIQPLHSKNGNIIGIGCSATDITTSIICERRKQNTLQQETDKRISELESFCYSVSHDLKAPLRCINRYSVELLKNYTEILDTTGIKYLNSIYCGTCRMEDLINGLLSLSLLGHKGLNKTLINIDMIIDDIIDEQQKFAGKKLDFIQKGALFPVQGDTKLIRLAFSNLISNAIKFSKQRVNPEITIGSYLIKNEVIYFVRDNGVGFEMKYINKLFEVFERLHNSEQYEGTGIGLAITKKIINMHCGKIWAESNRNDETIFYISLPSNNF
jgi:K+-sensing histidine kinase KdpD